MICLHRSVQIWFQNTRNRKKRLANYLNNCNQTTSIAVDYSIEYSQTTAAVATPTTTTSINEYSNYSQTTTAPRTVIKSKTTPATKTIDVPNNDNQILTNASSSPQPFVNKPKMTASDKTATVSAPDLPIGTTITSSAEEK